METSAFDGSTLLQGDIVSEVQLLGAIHLSGIVHLRSPDPAAQATAWQVMQAPKFDFAIVLSHSCEIDRSNKIKVTSIILSPVRDVNTATKPEKIEELIESNLIDKTNPEGSYLKYFYIEPNETIPYSSGSISDFSKCFSVRNKSYDYLLEKKVLQLRDDVRDSMALKLALYFHRKQEAA